jgi:general stress protein 26
MIDHSKIRQLVRRIRIGMLTTINTQGQLHSRPMSTLSVDENVNLWFFTGKDTMKALELTKDSRVNLSYADPEGQHFLSLTGVGELVRERTKLEELWATEVEAWFPLGLNDPNLTLLRFSPARAEFWTVKHDIGARKPERRSDFWEHDKLELQAKAS